MSIFGIGTQKRVRVTEQWFEQPLKERDGWETYINRTTAKALREIVAELDELAVPDRAVVEVGFTVHHARWDKTTDRALVEEAQS